MDAVDVAIDLRLQSDSTLLSLISTYRSNPAIFMEEPLPEGVNTPYIAVPAAAVQVPFDAKTGEGRRITRDISCYDAANGDTRRVDAIAERIRALFHRHPLVITGFETVIAIANGPSKAPTDRTLYGRTVTLQLTIWATT